MILIDIALIIITLGLFIIKSMPIYLRVIYIGLIVTYFMSINKYLNFFIFVILIIIAIYSRVKQLKKEKFEYKK